MPIRNIGTLLENIVLLETFRKLCSNAPGATVDFLNSFAMPPMSEWREHDSNACFSEREMACLSQADRPDRGNYAELMWICLRQSAKALGTQGPNGALLCALLAAEQSTPLRMWLNDVPAGHYGDGLPDLMAISDKVQQLLRLSKAPESVIVTNALAYPLSLDSPAASSLKATLASWSGTSGARIGFLDPMHYSQANPQAAETSSDDHRRWLRLLAAGCGSPVASVHFNGNRFIPLLRQEVAAMQRDGADEGYPLAVTASWGRYSVVVLIKHPDGENAGRILADAVAARAEWQWLSWCREIGRRKACKLTVSVEATGSRNCA